MRIYRYAGMRRLLCRKSTRRNMKETLDYVVLAGVDACRVVDGDSEAAGCTARGFAEGGDQEKTNGAGKERVARAHISTLPPPS
ncbi:hypothetical protein WN55_04045 [Dufourea novaeangliae]|uniref:Uncharacterized protein n=1 Tax=Dufourea novaeangliae TaxID=178035 RepID=A0A154PKM6_DUFNO|nr:hypothetical protein WN55_04045 [Dufourea novaeangliae]